jgi:hypothetical protein
MARSDELARQARATREQLSRTADELRARLNGPSLVDEMTGVLAQSGGSVMPERPVAKAGFVLPLALIGAGVAWLAMEARRREQNAERRRALETPNMLPVEPLPREQSLATVETVSLAPAPFEADKQDQRTLPL